MTDMMMVVVHLETWQRCTYSDLVSFNKYLFVSNKFNIRKRAGMHLLSNKKTWWHTLIGILFLQDTLNNGVSYDQRYPTFSKIQANLSKLTICKSGSLLHTVFRLLIEHLVESEMCELDWSKLSPRSHYSAFRIGQPFTKFGCSFTMMHVQTGTVLAWYYWILKVIITCW